ncbi:MAG TPA: GTP-binding protein [Candidatus Lokiarchaeia archaeon]|nr:GTP-binding protein [Candidatus Lokiarchaeia archaeon]
MVTRLDDILARGENKKAEFKRYLEEKDLKPDRMAKIQTQLRYISNFEPALFVIGVEDIRGERWEIFPLSEDQYKTSKRVLKEICRPIDLELIEEEKIAVDGGLVGVFQVGSKPLTEVQEEVTINIMGRVNAGKSTMTGVLLTGKPDDGNGLIRASLLIHPQEIRRGQTSDLHISFLGLDRDGNRLNAVQQVDLHDQVRVITEAARLLIFYDAPGHQEFSRTMVRSVLGAEAQYALLLIPANTEAKLIRTEEAESGLVRLDSITREQMVLVSQRGIPFFLAINKIDKAEACDLQLVEEVLKTTLKEIGRVPFFVESDSDIEILLRELPHNVVAPIFEVSCTTLAGIDRLFRLLQLLPVTTSFAKNDAPAIAYIDKIYRGIRGTNIVVSGTVLEGIFKPGQKINVFPVEGEKNSTAEGRIDSIEVFKKRVERVKAGEVFGFDLHKVPKDSIRRGQVVVDRDFPIEPAWTFDANVVITYHSVRIKTGYSPVMQCHTISQAVVFQDMGDKDYLALGDIALVRLRFAQHPEFLRPGDKFILREGNMRGFGTVQSVNPA